MLYMVGNDVPQSIDESLKLMKTATDKGHPESQKCMQ